MIMKLNVFLAAMLVATVSTQEPAWPLLNMHYGPDFNGFFPQPMTVDEAVADGFEKLSGCGENENFVGERYTRRDVEDIVLIYDVNGYIAGVQTLIPSSQCQTSSSDGSSSFDCSASAWYVQGEFFDGAASYFVTSYTVDPEIICGTGRTEEEFTEQGSGNTVLFQQSSDPTDLMEIPLTMAEMDEQWAGLWYEHNCFLNMGVHYFNLDYDPNQDCQEVIPFQVTYDLEGNFNGIVHQHFAPLDTSDGEMWEPVNTVAATSIIQSPPICVLDYTRNAEISTLHMYFRDYHTIC